MKSNAWDETVLAGHRSYIREESGREAFEALVDSAIGSREFETAPSLHGEIRDFAYNDVATNVRPFAFIINRHDLLFYVRLAGLKRVPGGFAGLNAQFNTAKVNPVGEWTVRIASRDDAQRLISFLFSRPTGVAAHEAGIPDGITREDVIEAINRLGAGEAHQFAESVKYDLIYEGRRYAPKAVIGLAAERVAGRVLGPGDFSGGESSKSTRILQVLGFDVERKRDTVTFPKARTPRSFTQYWKSSELDWHEAQEQATLGHAVSKLFVARGVETGDTVYIVTIINGRVHLGGALLVDEVVGPGEARKRFKKRAGSSDHILARKPQVFRTDLVIPMSTIRALRFTGNKTLVFKSTETLDTQTLRGVRELEPGSAKLLADLLESNSQQDREAVAMFPDEIETRPQYIEGASKQVLVNAYERDPKARQACLERHGFDCIVCGFNFEARYGHRGKDFIHVHHLKPMALRDGEYELNPVEDLRPVCPNCHAMLHRGERVLNIEELRVLVLPQEA